MRRSSGDSEEKSFQYCPLDSSEKEIRLLYLHPGENDGPISIELIHGSLLDKPHYLTLSYVWGVQDHFQNVLINDRSFPVSDNLFCALSHLRNIQGPDAGVPFWIDALCINQSDLSERSQQVSMMREIYSTAEKVLVWLGPPTEESELALAYIRAMEAYMYIGFSSKDNGKPANHNAARDEYYHPIFPFTTSEGTKRHLEPWIAVINTLDKPWWNRAWIAQEVSSPLSRATPLGNVEIIMGKSLQTLSFWSSMPYLAFIIIVLSDPRLERQNQDKELHLRAQKILYGILRLKKISEIRNGNMSISERIITKSAAFLGTKSQATSEQLLWALKVRPVLDGFRMLECAEPVDKIYAALPLVLPRNHPALVPDYNLPVAEVYTRIAECFIENEKCLSILASRSGSDLTIPSWVPDWRCGSEADELCIRYNIYTPIYNACGSKVPETMIQKERLLLPQQVTYSTRTLLRAKGVRIDRISKLSKRCKDTRMYYRPKWEKMLKQIPAIYAPTKEPILTAYRRTLTADVYSREDFIGIERGAPWLQKVIFCLELVEEICFDWITQAQKNKPSYNILQKQRSAKCRVWKRGLLPPETFSDIPEVQERPPQVHHADGTIIPDITQFIPSEDKDKSAARDEDKQIEDRQVEKGRAEGILHETTLNRVLCITTKGYIGLVPWKAQVGDQVVVLFGGYTPFVLRQRHGVAGLSENEEYWQLIGESYIHGFMDGEALKGLDVEGSGVEDEEFVIV